MHCAYTRLSALWDCAFSSPFNVIRLIIELQGRIYIYIRARSLIPTIIRNAMRQKALFHALHAFSYCTHEANRRNVFV